MDEHVRMLEFWIAKMQNNGIRIQEKRELLDFIIEISTLEKFYSITPEWIMNSGIHAIFLSVDGMELCA